MDKKLKRGWEEMSLQYDEEYDELLGEVEKIILERYVDQKDELIDYCLSLDKDELKNLYMDIAYWLVFDKILLYSCYFCDSMN